MCKLVAYRAGSFALRVLAILIVVTSAVVQAQPTRSHHFAFDPATADRMLVLESFSGLLWETDDGALTWQRVDHPGGVAMIAYAPTDPSVIYASAGFRRAWKSEDGGASWALFPTELFDSSSLWGLAVSPADPDIVTVGSLGSFGGPGGMCHTTDGGVSWSNRTAGLPNSSSYWSHDIVFSESHPEVMFARGHAQGHLLWSSDSGYTWHIIDEINSGLAPLHVSHGNPDLLYFFRGGTQRGVYRGPVSTREWERIDLGPFSEQGVRSVATDPKNPGRIAVALTSDIVLSDDDGVSWTTISSHEALQSYETLQIDFDPHHSNRLWVGGNHGLFALDLGNVNTDSGPGENLDTRLEALYPNPSRDGVTIPFELGEAAAVSIAVYDVLGRRMAHLVDGPYSSGRHEQAFSSSALAAGVYLIRMVTTTEDGHPHISTQRLTVTR